MTKSLYIIAVLLLFSIKVFGQESEFCNSFELSYNSVKKTNSKVNIYQSLIGTGLTSKYKKAIYRDRVNNLSVGITYQYLDSKIQWSIFESYSYIYYLESNQQFHSTGFVLADRLGINRERFGLFVDFEISVLYHFSFERNTWIDKVSSEWGPPAKPSIPLDNEIEINRIVGYFTIQPGLEYKVNKKVILSLGFSYGENISSLYRDVVVSSFFPTLESFRIGNGSIVLGLRF